MNDQCACSGPRIKPSWRKRISWKIRDVAGSFYRRRLYRHVMRLAHRFNWHHMPPTALSPQYGEVDHWCQWCGLRGKNYVVDPKDTIIAITK